LDHRSRTSRVHPDGHPATRLTLVVVTREDDHVGRAGGGTETSAQAAMCLPWRAALLVRCAGHSSARVALIAGPREPQAGPVCRC
jgi:hypothetical protein